MLFKSSSIWHDINDAYDIVLENIFWILDKDYCINLWNDCWCSEMHCQP